MFKKVDFLIYIEHRVREFEAAKNIYNELINRGYKGEIIPIHYDKYLNVLKYCPKVVIVPFCHAEYDDFFTKFELLYNTKIFKINTHEEQITDKKGIEILMPKDDYAKNITHICWGNAFKDLLINFGVKGDLCVLTGSPRMDLIINNEGTSKKQLSEEFEINYNKKWFMIPTNFSLAFVNDEYLKNISDRLSDDIYERVDFTKQSMNKFFSILGECIDELSNFEIILRPHPYEDINNYNDILINNNLNKHKNIHIIRKYPVIDWQKASDKILTWTSTSAIEAAVLKKDTALLIPLDIPEKYRMSFFDYFPQISAKDQLEDFILEPQQCNDIESYLSENYYILDGKSYIRLADVISSGAESTNAKVKISYNYIIKYLIKGLLTDIPKKILYHLHLLDKVRPIFKGLLEDYINKKDYSNDYK